ncbi:MAG: hypothetical protein IPL86_13290 [Flavobacteriales bacterium]|nr:hypothetical protein [Flavobacteriales bacterium]
MDISTLRKADGDPTLKMNDIGRVMLRTTVPLHFDKYARNRYTGSFDPRSTRPPTRRWLRERRKRLPYLQSKRTALAVRLLLHAMGPI